MKKELFRWSVLLLVFSNSLWLQAQQNDQLKEQNEKLVYGKKREMTDLENIKRSATPQIRNSQLPALTKEDIDKITAMRSPNSEDVVKHQEFLKQKETGIFKLFPDLGCEVGRIVKADGDCANAVLFSWSYSFLKKDYVDGEIVLKEGNLVSDSFLSQNIIAALGDVTLENVDLQIPQAKFLLDFKPETKNKLAKKQFDQIAQKINENGFTYGKVAKVDENATFLIRIIAYKLSDDTHLRIASKKYESWNELRFAYINQDEKRRDKIIAFRIIRKDSDGSITILWKELADKKSPKLEFEKDEKLTDLKEK